MAKIQSSTDLRNKYNEISKFCNDTQETVFITKNGRGDLAVMSIERYEQLQGKLELYQLLDEGHRAVKEGRKRPFAQVVTELERELSNAY